MAAPMAWTRAQPMSCAVWELCRCACALVSSIVAWGAGMGEPNLRNMGETRRLGQGKIVTFFPSSTCTWSTWMECSCSRVPRFPSWGGRRLCLFVPKCSQIHSQYVAGLKSHILRHVHSQTRAHDHMRESSSLFIKAQNLCTRSREKTWAEAQSPGCAICPSSVTAAPAAKSFHRSSSRRSMRRPSRSPR